MNLMDGLARPEKFNMTCIRDYALLRRYVEAWAENRGHTALIIQGRPGILKSSLVKSVIGKRDCLYLEGFTGPLALYRDLYRKLNLPVVLDDIQISRQLLSILQPLWDNYDVHTLRWASAKPPKVFVEGNIDDEIVAGDDFDGSDGKHGGERGGESISLPTEFKTSSQCCLLTNSIDRLKDIPSLLDRAYIIDFDPAISDVLARAKSFLDPQIWAWGKRYETRLPNLSIRDLVQAGEDKRIGMPWERILQGRYFDPKSTLGTYLEVISDERLVGGSERVKKWTERTGKDRATFYRIQHEYRKRFPARNLRRGKSAVSRLKWREQHRKAAGAETYQPPIASVSENHPRMEEQRSAPAVRKPEKLVILHPFNKGGSNA
jgi:hypothetical protein